MSLPKVLLMLLVWLLYTIVAYKGCIEECCTTWTGDMPTSSVNWLNSALSSIAPERAAGKARRVERPTGGVCCTPSSHRLVHYGAKGAGA